MKICSIVPSYNGEATLSSLLEELLPLTTCVVVVDDGSEDGTSSVARSFASEGVVLLRHPVNLGKGAALRTGFFWALERGFDVAVTLDSDLQHSPHDLPTILDIFEGDSLDLLVGSRVHDIQAMPRLRRLGNSFSSWIASRFCHQRIPDSQCGYRVYRLGSCRPVLTNLDLDRFDAETEVIIRAALERLRIGFAPIRVIYPENGSHKSYYRTFSDTSLIVWFYVKEFLRRSFTPCGRQDTKRLKLYVNRMHHTFGVSFDRG